MVAQIVKNLPTMQETQIQSLAQEDPLEKVMTGDLSLITQLTIGRAKIRTLSNVKGCF